MQAVLTFLFGPVFCLLYRLFVRVQAPEKVLKQFEALQDTFIDINVQFSIPIGIAAAVELKQYATL
jgi:hypothetical protein